MERHFALFSVDLSFLIRKEDQEMMIILIVLYARFLFRDIVLDEITVLKSISLHWFLL